MGLQRMLPTFRFQSLLLQLGKSLRQDHEEMKSKVLYRQDRQGGQEDFDRSILLEQDSDFGCLLQEDVRENLYQNKELVDFGRLK